MNASAMRRGACPTLPEPMPTGDGLLARLALAAPLTPAQLAGLATLCQSHGNGIAEVTARGSLQVRGLTAMSARALAEGISELGIAVREGPAVEVNPLAGIDPTAKLDPRPLAQEIARSSVPLAGRLAPKVTVIVDGGGALHLGGLTADIRLRAIDAGWLVLEAGGVSLGVVGRHEAAEAVSRLLALLAAEGPEARMAGLVTQPTPRHPEVRAQRASKDVEAGERPSVVSILRGSGFALAPQDDVVWVRERPPAQPIGTHNLTDGRVALGIGLAFGQIEHAALAGLAALAGEAGASGIAACFGRALLVIGLTDAEVFRSKAADLGFITDPHDPRRSVSTCPGRPACTSGRIETRQLAARLAPLAGGRSLHVSGCAKGCAHPSAAHLTIVGLDGGAGLVVEGGPRDAPRLTVTEAELPAAARRILERHGG